MGGLEVAGINAYERSGEGGFSAGLTTASRGRAHRSGCVEAVEGHSLGLHLIEVGSFEVRVSIISNIAPAMVVGHNENNIGMFRS